MLLLNSFDSLPLIFGLLIALSTLLVWRAFAPARTVNSVAKRLDNYVEREDMVLANELAAPFITRTIAPLSKQLLRLFGRLMPQRSLQMLNRQLVYAGEPGGLTALDFLGVRLLTSVTVSGSYMLAIGQNGFSIAEYRNTIIFALIASLFPSVWLRRRVRTRQTQILRALPDAMDMLTIGVEAGLAFESALLRVGEQWDNELAREFRRVVQDIRLGGSRNDALSRLVERTGVEELATFVAVLIQSNQMGISISQVLYSQAHQMRLMRRQRAEEQARQASVKLIITLVLFVFPSIFIVLLGPSAPRLLAFFQQVSNP